VVAAGASEQCVDLPEGTYTFTDGKLVAESAGLEPGSEVEPAIDPEQWRGRLEDDLRQGGLGWLNMKVEGPVVLLTGNAPDMSAKSEALEDGAAAIAADDFASSAIDVVVDAIVTGGAEAPLGQVLVELGTSPSVAKCESAFGELLAARGLTFNASSSSVSEESTRLADALSGAALICDETAIEIGGHTDARGAESYNQRLSQNRANTVRDYMIGKGVSSDRLKAVGYGETQPLDTTNSSEAYARNRRMEFKLTETSRSGDD
jgi:outer membrane protein OmpA-like peptidoglycan-associated protein